MPQAETISGFLIPALILMAAALALTAFRVDAALDRGDGEKLFWIGFTGLLAALLAVAWAVAGSPGARPLDRALRPRRGGMRRGLGADTPPAARREPKENGAPGGRSSPGAAARRGPAQLELLRAR
ncbi:hypothetical protein OL239_00480 [Arthrobacter sp. ATA002]|uniref:hypothetical protein n=1 Tax=Arthrobacter sp. ATA002 TaxID=2991715 RepID=UPI0022A7F34B|nr:hypothetical protein [Arthrobacter sp. ATA002]WAP51886.1 hypothetical protein OL239_00480 [Arthrobacter sp. ATA002]